MGGLNDTSDVKLRNLRVNHRWRDDSLANVWEVETNALHSQNLTTDVRRQDATLRVKAYEMPFKPRAEINSDGTKIFGDIAAEIGPLPVTLSAGRVNWGDLSNNPRALAARLTASRLSAQTSATTAAGYLFGRVDLYNISDGNTISSSTLRFTPAWRPFGANLKPLLGFETRNAKFNTLNYWSPSDGYGSAFAGVSGEWESADWNFYASAQKGVRLFGEAGASWSLSAGGKRWLNRDWAVGIRFWAMSSQRDYQQYKARSTYVTVEKLWN
jgi:hypothetical protein